MRRLEDGGLLTVLGIGVDGHDGLSVGHEEQTDHLALKT